MSYNASFVSALKEALNGLKTIHQVGEEWVSYVGDIPTGGVPYCGQEVNRETYSALWSYAQAKGLVKSESEWQSLYNAQGGNVAFYSSGNGSSTFRMPRLVGYVRGASSQSESGSYVKEGLPNIVGTFDTGDRRTHIKGTSGALYNNTVESGQWGGTSTATGNTQGVGLDASLCSSVYGNSSHVTPETSVVLYGVYAFGEIGNTSALDASTLASAVARVESNLNEVGSVVDSKLSNLKTVVETWSSGTSWYRVWSDGWIEQGGLTSTMAHKSKLTFNTAFSNTNYVFTATGNFDSYNWVYINTYERATSNCMLSIVRGGDGISAPVSWYACGY